MFSSGMHEGIRARVRMTGQVRAHAVPGVQGSERPKRHNYVSMMVDWAGGSGSMDSMCDPKYSRLAHSQSKIGHETRRKYVSNAKFVMNILKI